MHDHSNVAWAIVASYAVAVIAALGARSATADPKEKRLWLILAVALLALGVNKQLDLQTTLTQFARVLARQEHWYSERRTVQLWFLLLLGFGALGLIVWIASSVRRLSPAAKGAAFGVLLLVLFVFTRAASFHHLDQWLRADAMGLRRGWVLELIGIWIIAVSGAIAAMGRGRFKKTGDA